MSIRFLANLWQSKLKNSFFLISLLTVLGFASANAQAEIRILAAGGGLLGAPYATEEIISNGDVIGTITRPSWSDYRLLTTADIIANYDVFVIPWNTDPLQYDFDWDTRLAPILASGMGVIWEAPMTTGYAGSPLFTMLGNRYLCNDGSVCWIPDTPLNVLSVPGITDGITGDFGSSTGYFTSWDSALTPFINVDATDLGTVVMGLYGQYGAGRIIITHNEQDTIGASTGTAAQVNAYNLMINKLEWVAASTVQPDPNLRVVPDTDGLTEADAVTAFNNAGFVISNTFYTTTNIDASGFVVSQDPQAGAVGFVGDPVTLFVVAPQTGSPVTVPDVTGIATADAETALLAVGLERGQLTWGYSPTVPAGDVITQNPAAGSTDITTGWIVDLVESNGNLAGRVPYVKFLTQTEAGNAIIASGYVMGDIATASHNVIPSGSIVDQVPWPGATLAGGEPVALVVSTGPAGAATITTPDVAGLTQAAAESSITSAGLIVGTVSTSSSETVPAGNVISQSPVAGTLLASGAAVNLLVSSGPASISVPDVVDLPQATAESTLSGAGLTVGVISNDWSDTVAAGAVISQDPAAGTTVGIGSIVNLVISDGPEPGLTIVPDVRQSTQADAEASINALLVVGEVTFEYSPQFPVVDAGNVISTNPSGGALVYVGSTVDIVVSLGAAPIATPDVRGLPQVDAETAIVAADLVVGTVTPFPSETVPVGNVISQSPLVGYLVAPGTAVDLTISSGPVPVEISVPSVVGLSQAAAETAITEASLTVGVVLTANSETVAAGDVISQNPVAGTNVSEGSTVDLVVSLGPVAPPPPPAADYSYYVLNPLLANGSLNVVSLSDGNTITAGNTTLNLNQYESGSIPASDLTQGTHIVGTGPFDLGSNVNNADMPVPSGFAGTEFVLPHYRSTHLYYLMSPAGNATASINIGGVITNLNLTEGNVVEFNAGSSTTISGIVTSDNPILMAHRTSDTRDAYPVAPAATEIWGIRSNNVALGALEDNTSITVYASNGSSSSYNLDAGDRVLAAVGSSGSEGAGNAFHIVADKPVAAIQAADSDGVEATSFWPASYFATSFGLPVNTQYVAVTCFDANTTVTLNDGGSVVSQTCSASGNTPGKAFFGSTADGTNIGAGATIESDNPVYVYYEDSTNSDENNLLGNVSFGPVATPDVSVPSVTGMAQASAESAIAAAGLTLGTVTTANSSSVPAGNVISQTPLASTMVFTGDSVDLVVSIGPAIVNTPNVLGLSQASAENAITSAGLVVGTITMINSTTVAAGDVISQSPAGGSSVTEGTAVDLTISLGPVMVTTPGVVGLSQAAAETAITNAGLTVGTIATASSATIAAGNVINQSPAGGSSVAEGSAIDLTISTGPAIVTVPNVIGQSQAGAESSITSAGLVVGTITTINSTTVAAGDVISQSPNGGASLTEGSSVDLTVSLGPVIVSTPSVVGLSQAVAENAITTAGLSVGAITSTNSATVAAGDVISQNPTGGSNVAEGTAVDLVISLGAPPAPTEPTEVFYDSFENGAWNGLWTEDSQGDWFTNSQRATSGSRSAEVDGFAGDAQLISMPIDLQGGTQASITFNWYIEGGLDTGEYLAFDVSTNGGASWTQQATLRGNADAENTWHSEQVDLSGIASLQVRFRARMSSSREDANVDEVRVTVQ